MSVEKNMVILSEVIEGVGSIDINSIRNLSGSFEFDF